MSNFFIVLMRLAAMVVMVVPSGALAAVADTYSSVCTADAAQCACQELNLALTQPNGTIFSDDAFYEDAVDENYSAICRLPAACVINPDSTEQVATAIQIIAKHGAEFAVRSGGHNYNPGFASINETGVLISLSQLDTIELSGDLSSVKVGSGNRWQAIYDSLVPKSVMPIGGRVGPVGVGGLMLGGGLSYFSSEYGLALDNVKSFEVVLGNGSIIAATPSGSASDLYKALRGGMTNFGIVTNFELFTRPIGNIFIDARAYSPNRTIDFFNAVDSYQKQGQLDTKSSVTVQVLETGPIVLMLYSGDVLPDDTFAPFYDLGSYQPIATSNKSSLLDVLAISNSRFVTGNIRVQGETFSHESSSTVLNDLYKIWVEETIDLPGDVTSVWVPNIIAANVATLGKQNGGNLLNLHEAPQVWYESYFLYEDPSYDELVKEVAEEVTDKCVTAIKAAKATVPYLFANTAGSRQPVLQGYGNIPYMETVAAKYDPEAVFQKYQKDGFLLRDV
ncbi:FAD-binding domain-containing protein [Xylariaceae sp. FL1272]|nr:FAD-binding domain-containing protein [Xylariaceae sp. FL1272]